MYAGTPPSTMSPGLRTQQRGAGLPPARQAYRVVGAATPKQDQIQLNVRRDRLHRRALKLIQGSGILSGGGMALPWEEAWNPMFAPV